MTILPPPPASGAFMKFADKGDTVTGHLLEVRGDGSTMQNEPCPLLVIDTGNGEIVKVTCSQAQLWSKTVDLHRAGELTPGRRIKVTLVDVERRPNGHTLKHFDIRTADADPAYVPAAASNVADEPF